MTKFTKGPELELNNFANKVAEDKKGKDFETSVHDAVLLGYQYCLMTVSDKIAKQRDNLKEALIQAKHMLDTSHGYWVTDDEDALTEDLHLQDFSKTIAMIEKVLKKVE